MRSVQVTAVLRRQPKLRPVLCPGARNRPLRAPICLSAHLMRRWAARITGRPSSGIVLVIRMDHGLVMVCLGLTA